MDRSEITLWVGAIAVAFVVFIMVWRTVRAQVRSRERRGTSDATDSGGQSSGLGIAHQSVEDSGRSSDSPLPSHLQQALIPTRSKLSSIFRKFSDDAKVTDQLLEELEETLITADFGVSATRSILHAIPKNLTSKDIRSFIFNQCVDSFVSPEMSFWDKVKNSPKPFVLMIVGVNGVGKTTTIGKLASQAQSRGLKVMLGAGDTFRAAASEQLKIWATRAQVPIVSRGEGADPASVLFDSVQSAKARDMDLLICDTAGRLQTKQGLMDELSKCVRVIQKVIPDAPHDTWLVVDATTGQNALHQADAFHESLKLTGLVLTKLDGTAKGGIVVAISQKLHIPVQFVGIGEKIEDLSPFSPQLFTQAILPLDPPASDR